jgi:hypothetical protein
MLLLTIVQVPAVLLTLPVIAYVFATEATTPAIIFAVWTLIAGLSDNVLKPMMLGRGLEAPMPLILIGVYDSSRSKGGRRLTFRRRDCGSCGPLAGDVGMPCTPGAGIGGHRALLRPGHQATARSSAVVGDLPAILDTDDRAYARQYRPGCNLGAALQGARCF